jgi:hypothetical protein
MPDNQGNRIDWNTLRDRIDLTAVATQLLGEAARSRNGRKWWCCPFHQEDSASFFVKKNARWWGCYGCGERGDAASLVMRLQGKSFPEALAELAGGPSPSEKSSGSHQERRPTADPPRSTGIPEPEALALVADAERRLWTSDGEDALAYLHARGLNDDTIRTARLGVVPPLDLPGRPRGIVVPWFEGDRPTLLKLRQPDGWKPKYREVFRNRPTIYPDPAAIRPGRPLVATEGEFDALLLGLGLGDMASVVTLGSASARPDPPILGRILAAAPWFIATDGDEAGDRSAEGWLARSGRCRRVRPPGSFKDWTEAHLGGVGLRRWWADRLSGVEHPTLYTWDELSGWRWGDAVGDSEPGLVVDRPDRARMMTALRAGASADIPGAV